MYARISFSAGTLMHKHAGDKQTSLFAVGDTIFQEVYIMKAALMEEAEPQIMSFFLKNPSPVCLTASWTCWVSPESEAAFLDRRHEDNYDKTEVCSARS